MKEREFPGSPAVRTQYSNRQEPGLIHSIHSRGTKILEAAAWPKNKYIKSENKIDNKVLL